MPLLAVRLFTGLAAHTRNCGSGFAFGLGGKDAAARFLAHLEAKVERRCGEKENSGREKKRGAVAVLFFLRRGAFFPLV